MKNWGDSCHNDLAERFVNAALEAVGSAGKDALLRACSQMREWQRNINGGLDDATDEHLSVYAGKIRKVALLAMALCRKYRVYDDIKSFGYNEAEEMLEFNGEPLYFLS